MFVYEILITDVESYVVGYGLGDKLWILCRHRVDIVRKKGRRSISRGSKHWSLVSVSTCGKWSVIQTFQVSIHGGYFRMVPLSSALQQATL